PCAIQLAQHGRQFLAVVRILSKGWLVQNQNVPRAGEHRGDAETALLPLAEGKRVGCLLVGQVQLSKQRACPLPNRLLVTSLGAHPQRDLVKNAVRDKLVFRVLEDKAAQPGEGRKRCV